MVRKSGKAGYQQSYPHYPHFFPLKREVYIVILKTCVLYKSDKILFCEKSEGFLLTSLMSKYNVNYLKIIMNNDNYSQPQKAEAALSAEDVFTGRQSAYKSDYPELRISLHIPS